MLTKLHKIEKIAHVNCCRSNLPLINDPSGMNDPESIQVFREPIDA